MSTNRRKASFQESQDQVMDFILNAGDLADRAPERIPRLLRGPLTNAVGMADLLVVAYDSTLAALPRNSR